MLPTQLGEYETWESYAQERNRQQDEFLARFLTSGPEACESEDIVYLARRIYGKTLTLARFFAQLAKLPTCPTTGGIVAC